MSETKKKMQLELLMEKLRHKTHQLNLTDSAKAFRMTILERRYGIDAVEKAQYHKCLDLLQTNMKVTSLQSMLERLESISRQAGLKFTADGSGRAFFISSDMFYLEVIVESTGKVQEVHIQHEGRSEPQTCNEIASCLNSGNFSKFTTHLQGLCAIYQISADKKLKAKAFQALSALELDLSSMSQLPTYSQDISSLVHKSPLGMVTQRIGGLPLTLTYFLSPYDLIKAQSPNISAMLEKIADTNLGLSCTVGIESAGNYQLPITPLLSVSRNSEGESVPAFSQLSPANSASLPATFILKMREPLILCLSFAQQIQSVTGVPVGTWDQPAYLFSSLVRSICSSYKDLIGDEFQATKAYRVTLPDQHHSYYVTESEDPALKCCSVSSIFFNHPSHVPLILSILRRQAILNTLLSSCIRPKSQTDSSPAVTFEISAITLDRMSVSFEHPLLEEMCCAEIDLSPDPSRIHCSIYCAEEDGSISSEYSTKVLQRCLSIPVTMRAILRQMQSSTSRWGNGNPDHHGTFDRRFQSHINGDVDSHQTSNGHYGTSSYTSGNGNGGFDGSHSPRTHNMGDNKQQLNGMQHITPKEGEGYGGEAEQMNDVTMVEDGSGSANRSKAAYSSSSESWTPSSLANTDVSLFNGMDSGSNQSTGQPALMRRSSDLKHDSPGTEISVLEQLAAEIPPADDSNSQSEGMDSLFSKGKESPSPKSSFPSVSITPVNSVQPNVINSSYPTINMERRPGIEIIPFNKDPSGGLPSSLTITPVGGSSSSNSSSKSSKDKSSKYKDGRGFDSPDGKERDRDHRDRDRDKERERKERKRRREEEKSPNSGGKPSKMLSLGPTLMGPPGSVPKMDGSPSRSHKSSSSSSSGSTGSNHSSGSTPPTSSGLSPLMSPSRSSSKSSTPSSSPKHPSSGGKPSMSALSMSALKSASSVMGSTSPSSKPKKSKDRDRERSSSDRDQRDKDREKRDRERSKDREKKSRTPTPTSNHHSSSRNPPLVKTKSLDFSLAIDEKSGDLKEDSTFNALLALAASSNNEVFSSHPDIPTSLNLNNHDVLSLSPTLTQDPEHAKIGIGASSGDSAGLITGGSGGKSPLRSRKSSLSAVIDKLRLQHNNDSEIFQNGPKYANDGFSKKEQDGAFLEDFVDENDSPRNSKVNDVADVISFDQMNSGNNSPGDPFGQGLENLPCQSA